jgi:hypothetical protein
VGDEVVTIEHGRTLCGKIIDRKIFDKSPNAYQIDFFWYEEPIIFPTIDALCDSLRKQYEELTKGGKE